MNTKPSKASRTTQFHARIRGLQLTPEDQRRLAALKQKFPEQNDTILIRRAIREMAERENVA